MKHPIPATLLAGLPDSTWSTCTDTRISVDTKVPEWLVRAYRALYDKPRRPRKPGSGRPRKVTWSGLRADQTAKQNAERLGVTRQHIYHIKKQQQQKGTK